MNKAKEIREFLDSFTKSTFGHSRTESKVTQTCVVCGGDANTFEDDLSRKEYEISGMCQTCQDEAFTS